MLYTEINKTTMCLFSVNIRKSNLYTENIPILYTSIEEYAYVGIYLGKISMFVPLFGA